MGLVRLHVEAHRHRRDTMDDAFQRGRHTSLCLPADGAASVCESDDADSPFNTTFRGTTGSPRNLPVKRYDGEPLSRSDLQHNVLCQLFDSTERCFINPRPGPRGPRNSTTWRCPVPVYPQGMAKTCARPSDETAEERKDWETRIEAFEKAPYLPPSADDPVYSIDTPTPSGPSHDTQDNAEGSGAAKSSLPPLLRQKQGYPPPGNDMLTFKELYMEALLHSGKCTKAMRDKMLLDEEFAEDFAKVCLLVNVGRINTTLACEYSEEMTTTEAPSADRS